MKIRHLFISIALSAIAVLALTWALSTATPASRAASNTYTVCPAGPPTCDYAIIQEAVDAAGEGDIIKVATGDYTDVNNYGGLAQIVYISKTVTLRGGYTVPGFADPPDPEANPTTLDAQGLGRVLYITGNISPTVEGLRITGGDAAGLGGGSYNSDAGGGMYIITATATLSSNTFINNLADNGSGIYLSESPAILTSNIITGNVTNSSGGGLYLSYSDATLHDNTVASNSAIAGGGVYLSWSDATLTDNTIISNTASVADGGGLYLNWSKAILSKNTIHGNTAGNKGGGLYLTWSDATLMSSTITANSVGYGSGGGAYLYDSNAALIGNTITDNIAGSGGGLNLYLSGATLNGNTVTGNSAVYGGGLYLASSPATISSNLIASNTASLDAGGVYLGQSNATLNGNTITANSATGTDIYFGGGGGLGLWKSAPILINNIIADNQTNTAGSGLHIRGASPHLFHTTLARNHGGDGSGVYVTDKGEDLGTVELVNTILTSHTVGISVTAGNTATLEATLWGSGDWANGTDWGGDGTVITGTINVWGDPAFVDPGAGDYHIGPGSAALNRGVDAGVTVDIDGEPRPSDAGYDIGADEYWPAGPFKFVYLPLVLR